MIDVYARQMFYEGLAMIVAALAIAVVFVIVVKVRDSDGGANAGSVAFLIVCIGLVVTGAMKVANPDYYARREIIADRHRWGCDLGSADIEEADDYERGRRKCAY